MRRSSGDFGPHKRRRPTRLKIVIGVATAFLAVGIYLRLFWGEVRDYEISPDGKYIAEWRVYNESSATTTNLSTIQIRSRSSPFRRTVLSGLDYGAQFSLVWIDSKNLVVQCGSCGGFNLKCDDCNEGLYVESKETSWHDVTIRYTNEALAGATSERRE